MSDPFAIAGPAIVSVSGGRTSGYMLWRILQAHGGTLPADVRAVFANTGREMPATLDFVHAMAAHWGVRITWLEFLWRRHDGYEVVSHNSASRSGEPFERFLANASALPNPVQRSCTAELKIRTIKRWAMRELGWTRWSNIVGIRADEPTRVENHRKPTKERWTRAIPLADAGVTVGEVAAFWRAQPFDLGLAGKWEGNCDGCFLKSRAAVQRMQHDYPERMAWWASMEAIPRGTDGVNPRGTDGVNRRFRTDRPRYAALALDLKNNPRMPLDETMIEGGEACDGGCGI